ncbi:MAG: ABC transporter ATP-binding protein [Gemmatimonadota bacterium]|nr:ABC transporter ATP-binding protein [Gemmatimonadota bacterium]MDH5282849.1 ABC transporter ATP-binding protein [Gemmatimonadota bacterium]
MSEPLLVVRGLSVEYRERELFGHGRRVPAVEDVSLEICRGETLALVGESGSGKSSLAQAIVRLVDVSAGEIRFAGDDVLAARGESLRRLRRGMQLVFQDSATALNPRMRVGDAVAEGLIIHQLVPPAERAGRVAQLLEEVGLDQSLASRYPRDLSGGQRQRVGIARALAVDPALLICDEPVSALDVSIQAQILALLRGLQQRRGMAGLIIAHDLAVVRQVAQRTMVMYLGRVVESGPTEAILASPRHPYTQALIASAPDPDPSLGEVTPALRSDLSTARPEGGCPFEPRCTHPRRDARCRAERPALREEGGVSSACHYGP